MQSRIDGIESLDLDSELNILDVVEVNKGFEYVVRWLRNKTTTRFLEDNPAARDVFVTVVQEVTQPLLTPAPTPSNSDTPSEQAPTLLSSQYIAQEESGCDDQAPTPLASRHVIQEGEFGCEDSAIQYKNVSGGHHERSSRAARQELEQGSRALKYTHVEVADDSESEESGGSQHSADPDGWPSADHGDDLHDQDACPNDQSSSEQSATLIQYESGTSQYPSRKRKHNFELGRDSKRSYIEAADATEVEVGSRSLEFSGSLEPQPETDQGRRHDQQPEVSEAGKDARRSSPAAPGDDLSNGGSDRFTKLSVALREKLGRIADPATLATVWEYLNYKRTPPSSIDDCADASEQDASPDISSSDQRLKELKNRIVRDEREEESINHRQIAARISKRVALAELIGSYLKERDARRAVHKKKRKKLLGGSSPKDRFTDLLFPETVQFKEKLDKQKDEQKGKQLGKKENGPRENATIKLNYWIQLGEPLAEMAQRCGIAIVPLLPKKLTDKNLHKLARPQIPLLLDYIDFIRPGLKEQVCNLSTILPQIVDNRLPPQRLVLETLTSNLLPQLRDGSLEELFQFDTNVTDSHPAGAGVGSFSDPGQVNRQLSYAQGTIEPIQNTCPESLQSQSPRAETENGNQLAYAPGITESVRSMRPDCTPESLQSRSPSAEIEDGDPSNSTIGYSKFARPSACHEKSDSYQEQFNRYLRDPFYIQDDDQSAQPQPLYSGESIDPQDYYVQDDDWRAQQPSGDYEGESPNHQDGGLQRSELNEAEFSDFDSFINCPP